MGRPSPSTSSCASSRRKAPAHFDPFALVTRFVELRRAHQRSCLITGILVYVTRLCAPKDPSPLRAHAPAGPLWGTRRVPPRGHRPKPQDTRQLFLAPAAAHTGRIVCVSDSPERWCLNQCRRLVSEAARKRASSNRQRL